MKSFILKMLTVSKILGLIGKKKHRDDCITTEIPQIVQNLNELKMRQIIINKKNYSVFTSSSSLGKSFERPALRLRENNVNQSASRRNQHKHKFVPWPVLRDSLQGFYIYVFIFRKIYFYILQFD